MTYTFGVNQDAQTFLRKQKEFFDKVFFPTIDKANISIVICLGDILERRKYINFYTADVMRKCFFEPLRERSRTRNLRFDWILGNHDIYYRELMDISGGDVLAHGGHIIKEAVTFNFVDTLDKGEYTGGKSKYVKPFKVCYIPWICRQNEEQIYNHIQKTDAQYAFGHLELAGFEANRGYVKNDGINPGSFSKFKKVYSGHYHHPSKLGNIEYLGACSQMDWLDYDDPRGFHIFDTDTEELTFIKNPYDMFAKVYYDDRPGQKNKVNSEDVREKVVKVVVSAKNDPARFDLFMSAIEDAQPLDIQVVEDHLNINLTDDESIISESKDTLSIIREFLPQAKNIVNVEKLDNLVVELYNKAQQGIER